ncbi:MAG: diguanylate cyclase [Gemmatimonadales bacterium]|nr:MAG: diguanylate cyclase [Gemmatimonadales bacterium]
MSRPAVTSGPVLTPREVVPQIPPEAPVMDVLVVDDDALALEALTAHLRHWGHTVLPFPDAESAWRALEHSTDVRMAILDWMLPGMTGIELCRRIRDKEGPYVYTLLLTGRSERGDLLAGFEAGADDYLTKPYDWDELRVRVRAGERIVRLQNELISAREALRTQAMQDPLTKILNHGAIVDALNAEIDRAERESHPLALILLDIDHFKDVNDTFGHLVGDEVLREVARRLRNCLRSYDSLGRYGGEEFLVVLPNIERNQAVSLAQRIRRIIASQPVRVGDSSVPITLSQGIATWDRPRKSPSDPLIGAADRALYAAKAAGRDAVRLVRFEFIDPDSQEVEIPSGIPPELPD